MARLDEALEEIYSLNRSILFPPSLPAKLLRSTFINRTSKTALEAIDQAIELNPHFAPSYWTLGLIEEQRGEFDESIAAFQRALQLSPESPRMHGAIAAHWRSPANGIKRLAFCRICTRSLKSVTCRRSNWLPLTSL